MPDTKQETNKKHAGGRPLAFKTVEGLQAKIDEYFSYCDNRTKTIYDNKTGHEIVINFPAPCACPRKVDTINVLMRVRIRLGPR